MLFLPACSSLIDPNVPEPIRPLKEPEFHSDYLLYKPSTYDRRSSWPLIVACHSGFPDSPNQRIRTWTRTAESLGFLVAAPTLTLRHRDSVGHEAHEPTDPFKQREAQLLSMIRHIQAGYTVSEERIFLHGWSDGATMALYAGLRNPDIFRALAVSQPKADERLLTGMILPLDPHQPVFIHYNANKLLTGKRAQACADWLRRYCLNFADDRSGSVRQDDVSSVLDFYLQTLRTVPLIRIRAVCGASGDPLEVRLLLRCSIQPKRVHWQLGDSADSNDQEPVYRFPTAGTHQISLTVIDRDGRDHRRDYHLTLPEGTIQSIAPPPNPRP